MHIHAGVKARSILLVLQTSLGQVNGKHTGHSDQASDPPIDQFGRQTAWRWWSWWQRTKMRQMKGQQMKTSPVVFISSGCIFSFTWSACQPFISSPGRSACWSICVLAGQSVLVLVLRSVLLSSCVCVVWWHFVHSSLCRWWQFKWGCICGDTADRYTSMTQCCFHTHYNIDLHLATW